MLVYITIPKIYFHIFILSVILDIYISVILDPILSFILDRMPLISLIRLPSGVIYLIYT